MIRVRLRKLIRALASLRLALVILGAITVLIALGTVVEARYDAWTAKNLVYASAWMYAAMIALALSLAAVIVDRWPWRRRHAAFILAHLGIILILFGAFLTQAYGVDGTLTLSTDGAPAKDVIIPDAEINVYRSFDGADYEKVHGEPVNFLRRPVREDAPFVIRSAGLDFAILRSIPYAMAKPKVEVSPHEQSGAAVRFQLRNENTSESGWLVQRNVFDKAEKQIGPVLITMGGLWERTPAVHEIRMTITPEGELRYALYAKNEKDPRGEGRAKPGDVVPTGWMNLEFRVLSYLPKALQKFDIEEMEYPNGRTQPSLRVRYNEHESHLFLNDYVKIFSEDRMYLVAYQNRRVPLGFSMNLVEFKKREYPGTMRAMSYESAVTFDDGNRATISMNEPLKYKGLYLYQASFDESPSGRVTSSILSVNYDPGRPWKYAGSLIMCCGIVLLFLRRRGFGRQMDLG